MLAKCISNAIKPLERQSKKALHSFLHNKRKTNIYTQWKCPKLTSLWGLQIEQSWRKWLNLVYIQIDSWNSMHKMHKCQWFVCSSIEATKVCLNNSSHHITHGHKWFRFKSLSVSHFKTCKSYLIATRTWFKFSIRVYQVHIWVHRLPTPFLSLGCKVMKYTTTTKTWYNQRILLNCIGMQLMLKLEEIKRKLHCKNIRRRIVVLTSKPRIRSWKTRITAPIYQVHAWFDDVDGRSCNQMHQFISYLRNC